MSSLNFRLILFVIILTILELLINSSTKFYVDLLGIFLIIVLLRGHYSFKLILTLAIIADLIGHWYLGSHLLAIMLISFLSDQVINFFHMNNLWNKIVTAEVFYFILVGLLLLLGMLTHNTGFHWQNYFCEVVLVLPIILIIFNYLFLKLDS